MNEGRLSLWNFPNPVEQLATSLREEVLRVVAIHDSDCVVTKGVRDVWGEEDDNNLTVQGEM